MPCPYDNRKCSHPALRVKSHHAHDRNLDPPVKSAGGENWDAIGNDRNVVCVSTLALCAMSARSVQGVHGEATLRL